jgi:hypothetical protein
LNFGVFLIYERLRNDRFFVLTINNDVGLPTHFYFENADTATRDETIILKQLFYARHPDVFLIILIYDI